MRGIYIVQGSWVLYSSSTQYTILRNLPRHSRLQLLDCDTNTPLRPTHLPFPHRLFSLTRDISNNTLRNRKRSDNIPRRLAHPLINITPLHLHRLPSPRIHETDGVVGAGVPIAGIG